MCTSDDASAGDGGTPEPVTLAIAKQPTKSRAKFTSAAVNELSFCIWKACEDAGDLRLNLGRAMLAWKGRFLK